MFSFPLTTIFVDIKNCKQNLVQYPINLPPVNVNLWGKNNDGRYMIQIIIIPK